MTRTCGGTMSGNCATGSAVMAMMPAMVMTVEMTNASRGRRMNSDEIVMAYCFCVEAEGGATVGLTVMPGRTRCWPWTMTLSPACRPAVMAIRPSRDDAGLDALLLDHVLVVDDEQVGAGLVLGDRGLRHGDRHRHLARPR